MISAFEKLFSLQSMLIMVGTSRTSVAVSKLSRSSSDQFAASWMRAASMKVASKTWSAMPCEAIPIRNACVRMKLTQ